METLEALRKKIDSLDETLREAFLARMEAAAAIAGYKAQHGLPVLDAAREEAVAYQGVEGAFSHIALCRLFPHARAVGFAAWEDVFRAVESGEAEYGVLPFENSSAGDVSEVLDLCFSHPGLCVCDM